MHGWHDFVFRQYFRLSKNLHIHCLLVLRSCKQHKEIFNYYWHDILKSSLVWFFCWVFQRVFGYYLGVWTLILLEVRPGYYKSDLLRMLVQNFLQAWYPSCRRTNSVNAVEVIDELLAENKLLATRYNIAEPPCAVRVMMYRT